MPANSSPFSDQASFSTKLLAPDPVFTEQTYQSLRPVSLSLAVAFVFFVILGFIDTGPGGYRQALIVATDIATSMIFAAFYVALRSNKLGRQATHWLSLVFALLTLGNALLAFWLTEDAFFLTYLPMVAIGCGAFMLSFGWMLVVFLVLTLITLVVTLDVLPAFTLLRYSPALLGAFLVSILILAVRRWHVIESRRAILAMEAEAEERKRAEEHLAHVQRLESIGKLVSGIAHDFNNLLMVIVGYTDSLIAEQNSGSPVSDDLEVIRNAGEKAAALAAKLLAFSRQQVMELRALDVNVLIRGVEPLVTRSLPGNIQLVLDLDESAGVVSVDQLQMEQVLINLSLNARDAIGEEQGSITIRTRRNGVSTDESKDASKNHEAVLIQVADDGCGMPEDIRKRIFEPFFTTKHVGGGTGLGLAMVHGIVTQCGGRIVVDSAEGRGSLFSVYLNGAENKTVSVEKKRAPDHSGLSGLKVLVVDDEEGVRKIVARTLERSGCEARTAASAQEARTLMTSGSFDFLLTDIVMPGMSGVDLVKILRVDGFAQPVLLMSGHTGENLLPSDEPQLRLLKKPFGAEELLETMQAVLDGTVLELDQGQGLTPENQT